jgi:predicted O-linked N-acetylglucosamine transferase (SPINDLY family)
VDDLSPQRLATGWQAIERDDLRAAEQIARAALARDPRQVEFLYLLGSSLAFQNRFADALHPLAEVLERSPRRGAGHRLGYCHLALGDAKAAETLLRREVDAYPDLIDAYNALGVALIHQGRIQDALPVFLEAGRRAPASATANNNIANVLADLARYEEALPYLRKAIEAQPGLPDAHHNLAMLYQRLKRHEEAIAGLEEALRLSPGMSYTLSYLVWNKLSVCRWQNLPAEVDTLRSQVRAGQTAADPFTFLAVSPSPQEQRRCAERHAAEKLPRPAAPLWPGPRQRRDRIRLAYLSADFHEHATAQLAARLFELHDRARFELIGVSYGPDDGSPMRQRLQRAFDCFVEVRSHGDEAAARVLRELEVDIAVDLKGYTTGSRPGILAHRPAPVQVSYLGYPGTLGAPFIDYLLADRYVVPEHARQWYSENVVYLPDCYQVNDDQRPVAARTPTRAEAGLPPRTFVFCCFNNSYKIMPDVFAVWMRLLRQVSGSVLWLLEDNAAARRNLEDAARAGGVDPLRLVFGQRVAPAEHLARHRLADLFLDTLPYNAHTTASDALWSGLPLLTCEGTAFAGRVAGSLLRAVGIPELVASDLAEYESLALRLARDPALLREVREKLACNRAGAALFDTGRFCRHVEAAYAAMWQAWQRGQLPRGFAVAPVA